MRLPRTLTLIAVPLCLPLSSPAPAEAQYLQQGQKLVGTGGAGSFQGSSVSLSADGNTALVGGILDGGEAGAVWVWTRSGAVWSQQGSKLIGSGAVGNANQGTSTALSADGNTALVGGRADNSDVGAVWVWTRTGGVWTQQGGKLVGSGGVGTGWQGTAVALSADGNTALVGGTADGNNIGAVWVWTRSGGVWTQQGPKLVGTGAVGASGQGHSVSLSADGNTAIVGGSVDNGHLGAAWVWTRSGGVWTQQGPKLVGAGAVGTALQGWSVSLSADGNTALVSGSQDNGNIGATWVWTRSVDTWTQQGGKLIGTGVVGATPMQGYSVSLSADGNVALVGVRNDTVNIGAVLVWTRSGGVWAQRGLKLVGTGAVGAPVVQGHSVALSADGNTALVGGIGDSNSTGAAWVFTASTRRRDFDWDGKSDIVWQHLDGSTALWLMNGLSPSSNGGLIGPGTGWRVVQSADVDGDRKKDLVWQHTNGSVTLWLMNGLSVVGGGGLLGAGTGWQVIQTGDFNGDGTSDLLWRHSNGGTFLWLMNGLSVTSAGGLLGPGTGWSVQQVGDFNGDGKSDLLWQHTDGTTALWLMDGVTATSGGGLLGAGTGWSVIQTGDFNGDGKSDLLWRHSNGGTFLWLMNGLSVISAGGLLGPGTGWSVQQVGDFNGDGKSDLLWQHTDGSTALWLMDGVTAASGGALLGAGTGWSVVQTGDFNGDGKSDLVWQHPNGGTFLWLMNGLTSTSGGTLFGPGTGWSPVP